MRAENSRLQAQLEQIQAAQAAQTKAPAKAQDADEQWLASLQGDDDDLHPKVKEKLAKLDKLEADWTQFQSEHRTRQQMAQERRMDAALDSFMDQVVSELPGMDPDLTRSMAVSLLAAEDEGSKRTPAQVLKPLHDLWLRYHKNAHSPSAAPAASSPGAQPKAPPQIGAPATPGPRQTDKLDFRDIGKYIASRVNSGT